MQKHAEAHIGAVAAVQAHGLGVLHLLQREGDVIHAHGLQGLGHDAFHHIGDVVALHEGHLDIHLGELRLAIGAQILVAEAAGDLVVALHAGHHEHLLELLGTLGQGVELARVRAGRHDVVAGALGRGVRENGRLDLEEAALVQGPAHGLGHRVAQLQVGEHLRTTDVQVAPLHAGGLVGLDAVFNGERRRDRGVQHLHGVGQNLDGTGDHVRVHGLGRTLAHPPGDLQHVLAAQMLGLLEVLGAHAIRVHHNLGVAVAVAQVDEDEAAVVAGMPRPAGERHLLVHIISTQLPTGSRVHAILVTEVFHSAFNSPNQSGREGRIAGYHHSRNSGPPWAYRYAPWRRTPLYRHRPFRPIPSPPPGSGGRRRSRWGRQ